ncbi:MAG: SIS domain-containing protein [Patescibacteria group bacterium]
MTNLDPSNMRGMIQNFPNQFALGFTWSDHLQLPSNITNIIVTGMGGSALPTDLINQIFADQLQHPITVNRSYTLPTNQLTNTTLVIACSFSGNTEETISAYHQALEANCPVVVIAGGGQLIELAIQNQTPYVQLQKESPNFQPRMGSGYFFAALTNILICINWLPAATKAETISQAQTLISNEEQGIKLANIIKGNVPVFYSSDSHWATVRIAKIKFNENAKVPAFFNVLPEANHNEMVGYTTPNATYTPIFLADQTADSRINQRFQVMQQVLSDQSQITSHLYQMVGDTSFQKTFNTLILLDWASYHLALLNGIDPTPVALVEDFKALIKSPQVVS